MRDNPTEIKVWRLTKDWATSMGRWEAEVDLGTSPNFTRARRMTKASAIREARRRYRRSLVPEERVSL